MPPTQLGDVAYPGATAYVLAAGTGITLTPLGVILTIACTVTSAVSSVFGRTGAVVAVGGDYSVAQVTGAAPLASPTFTGTPAAPTAAPGDNTTQLATDAFVQAAVAANGVGLLSVSLTLTDAQIKALPSGDLSILGAPGAGKFYVVVAWTALVDATAGIYTNIAATASLKPRYAGGSGSATSAVVSQTTSTQLTSLIGTASINFAIGGLAATSTTAGNTEEVGTVKTRSLFENVGLSLNLSNAASGNLTGGNAANSMKVTLYYFIASF